MRSSQYLNASNSCSIFGGTLIPALNDPAGCAEAGSTQVTTNNRNDEK